MKVLCLPKVDINEGLRTTSVSKSAMICFDDVFFTLPIKVTNVLSGSEMKFNGLEIYNEAKNLIDSGQVAEAYDYLTQAVPEDNTFYVKMLDIFKITIGWWIFGSFIYRKKGGMRKTASIISRSKRIEIRDMYSFYVQN